MKQVNLLIQGLFFYNKFTINYGKDRFILCVLYTSIFLLRIKFIILFPKVYFCESAFL